MLPKINDLREKLPQRNGSSRATRADGAGFGPLHALAAELLLITGVEATRGALAGQRSRDGWPADRPADFERSRSAPWTYAVSLAPALIAPLAAAGHLKQMVRPTPATSAANRLLNTAVLGVGLVDLIVPLLRRGSGPRPSLIPLALASAGLLGLVLERQEQAAREERRRLQRRAAVVERLVPKRRPRLDRIVVHV